MIINGGRKNGPVMKYLPIKGVVRQRFVISDYSGWLMLELDKPILYNNKQHRLVLVRTKEPNKDFEPQNDTAIGIFLIPENKSMHKEKPKQEDLILFDWALIN